MKQRNGLGRIWMRLPATASLLAMASAPHNVSAQARPPIADKPASTLKSKPVLTAEPAVKLIGTITDGRITESSGLAVSRANAGVFWTHNDSGDGPYLYALDRSGKTLTRVSIPGATNVDWEDMASGPGEDARPALYVADFGDNNHNRDNLVLYRIPEPVLDLKHSQPELKSELPDKFFFRYPDGAHDTETLLVHPKTGEIVVVTKEGSGQSSVYAFPVPLQSGGKVTLQKVGTLTFAGRLLSGFGKRLAEGERMATGGAISPDGKRVFIRTYLEGYEWTIGAGQTIAQALKGNPRQTILPLMKQGESVCYRADSKAIYLTTEGVRSPIFEVTLE